MNNNTTIDPTMVNKWKPTKCNNQPVLSDPPTQQWTKWIKQSTTTKRTMNNECYNNKSIKQQQWQQINKTMNESIEM